MPHQTETTAATATAQPEIPPETLTQVQARLEILENDQLEALGKSHEHDELIESDDEDRWNHRRMIRDAERYYSSLILAQRTYETKQKETSTTQSGASSNDYGTPVRK